MPMISTTTANKQAITRTVTSSVRSHIDELVARAGESLYPAGVPDNVDLRAFFLSLADSLDRDFHALAAADREVARELGEDQQARTLRDTRAAELRESLFRVRSLVNAAFSQAATTGLGIGGRIPTRAESMIPFARNVAEKLAALETPATVPGFMQIDLAAAARDLATRAQALDDALTELARDIRETQAVQSQHSTANDTWQRHYGPIARMIEGCFLVAGMDHQAARVRPTARRNAGQPEETDLETPADADNDTSADSEAPATSAAAS